MASKVYRIEQNSKYGRYLVASRHVKQGELVLTDTPLLIGAQIRANHHVCFGCSTPLKQNLKICKACAVATVCSEQCSGSGHSEGECESLKKTSLRCQDILGNPQIVAPLRCLLLRQHDTGKWDEFMKLEAHVDARKGTDIWKVHGMCVEKVLYELGQINECDVSQNVVQKICGILDVNTFEVRPPNADGLVVDPDDFLRGLYLEASLMAHDCTGNTFLSVDDAFTMTVHASAPIEEGQMILFNYGNALESTHERRRHLREGKYFECDCKRCSDPSELGTHFSSVRCRKCSEGNVVPSVPLGDVFGNDWKCCTCGATYRGRLIELVVEEVKEKIGDAVSTGNITDLEKLLRTVLMTLSPQHHLVIELKQQIAMLYDRNLNLLTNTAVHRKIQLHVEIMEVLAVIEPGLSRLQAMAAFQLQSSQVSNANKLYYCKEISPGKYLELLTEAEGNLAEALKFLVHEPPRSPEGRLMHQSMKDLKILRSTINQLKDIEQPKLKPKDNVLNGLFESKCKIKKV